MKKVLFVIYSLNVGGAERQVMNDANMLFRLGYEVTVSFCVGGNLERKLDKGIRLLQVRQKNELAAVLFYYKHLNKEKFDCIFSHMYWALKVTGIPAFLTGHRLFFFEHGLGLWRKFHHLVLIRINEWFVERIIVVSSKKRGVKIDREKSKEEKIVIIPNSFRIEESSDIILNENFSDHHQVKIIFMGRFNRVKQLHILPGVCKYLMSKGLESFQFVLCGSGEEEKHLNELIYKENVKEYFYLPGYVDNPFSFLKEGDIFILPSRTEDFSVALLEAGYACLPAVAFDVGGNAEIIKNGVTGILIPPFDKTSFALAIRKLVEEPDFRKRMGKNAHVYIKERFTEQHRKNRILELIS